MCQNFNNYAKNLACSQQLPFKGDQRMIMLNYRYVKPYKDLNKLIEAAKSRYGEHSKTITLVAIANAQNIGYECEP